MQHVGKKIFDSLGKFYFFIYKKIHILVRGITSRKFYFFNTNKIALAKRFFSGFGFF